MASSTSWGFKRFIALTALMHGSAVTNPFLYQLNAVYKLCKRDTFSLQLPLYIGAEIRRYVNLKLCV